jgi:type IV pilus assembly protein PilW
MKDSGFTLVELLVALVVGGIIITAAYLLFISNQRTYMMQDEVVSVQQTIRPAAEYMSRYIRIAGLDPEQTGLFGLRNVTNSTIEFSFDRIEDGILGTLEANAEIKAFRVQNNQLQERDQSTNTWEPIAENVEALNFTYLNRDGNVIADPQLNIDAIRTIQISIIGRSRNTVVRYTNNNSYINLQGTEILPPQNDNFIRLMFSETVQCRNLGL